MKLKRPPPTPSTVPRGEAQRGEAQRGEARGEAPVDETPLQPAELSVDEAVDDAQESLDYAATYAYAPSALETGAVRDGVEAWAGRDPGVGVGDGARTAEAALTTGGVWANAALVHDGGARTSGDVYVEPGWVSGGLDHSWATASGSTQRAGASLALFDGGVGAFANFAASDPGGRTLSLNVGGWLEADRSIVDLGETEGDGRRIELSRSLGGSGIGSPGVLVDAIGLGGRFSVGERRKVVYRTDVEHDEAKRLLTERGGVVGWARDTARAAGLADEPVVIPDLRTPQSLAVGDELVVATRGKIRAGLIVGGLPFRVGVQGTMSGEFEVGVKRLDEHRLAVVVTPSKVRAIQARIGSPIALDADLSKGSARALRQSFVFDLREPEAERAYLKALDGELPGGVRDDGKTRPIEEDAVLQVQRALRDEVLPSGVLRTDVEAVHLLRTQIGLGFAVGLWHRSSSFVGVGAQRVTSDASSARVTRDAALTVSRRGVQQRRQVLISGEETRGVFASVRRRTHFDAEGVRSTSFDGLQLTLKLSDSRVRGLELNDEAIDRINEVFELDLPPFVRAGRKKTRDIVVGRTLGADDLTRLFDGPLTDAPHGGDDPLAALRDRLPAGATTLERANAAQDFVARGGAAALGAICRALGGTRAAYDVATTSSAYEEPVEQARALALRFDAPVDASTDKGALTRRFVDVERALQATRESIADARADPLLDDRASERTVDELASAQTRLAALLDLSHLDEPARQTLFDRLDRGWTTSSQRRIMGLLMPERA